MRDAISVDDSEAAEAMLEAIAEVTPLVAAPTKEDLGISKAEMENRGSRFAADLLEPQRAAWRLKAAC